MHPLFSKLNKGLYMPDRKPRRDLLYALDAIMALDDEEASMQAAAISLLYCVNSGESGSMFVTKQVSDDLIKSDIPCPDFGNVPWPMEFMEVIFEDQGIPDVLINRDPVRPWVWAYETRYNMPYPEELTASEEMSMALPTSDGRQGYVCHSFKGMDSYASGSPLSDSSVEGFHEDDNKGGVSRCVAALALLVFKVLLFAATPKFSPKVKLRKFGKPVSGCLRRSPVRQYIVEYLPHHIAEKKSEASKLGESHSFRGRRGHFRTYAAERFVNKKGDRDYIWPVPNPHGEDVKRKFIVRKP